VNLSRRGIAIDVVADDDVLLPGWDCFLPAFHRVPFADEVDQVDVLHGRNVSLDGPHLASAAGDGAQAAVDGGSRRRVWACTPGRVRSEGCARSR
jgi:hypothetical protein